MPRKYVKMEQIADGVFRRKASRNQIEQLAARQNRKKRKIIEEGYVARPKGRPRIKGGEIEIPCN